VFTGFFVSFLKINLVIIETPFLLKPQKNIGDDFWKKVFDDIDSNG